MASQRLITPVVRGSFPHLAQPHTPPGGDKPKFSIVVMLDKSNVAHMDFLKTLKTEMLAIAKERFPGKNLSGLKVAVKDGDESGRDEYAGHFIFNASASPEYRPKVVDANVNLMDPATIAEECYPGAWYRVSLRPYAWGPNVGGIGVSIGLVNVQKVKDGEPLGGSFVPPENDFTPFDETLDPATGEFREQKPGAGAGTTGPATGASVVSDPEDDLPF